MISGSSLLSLPKSKDEGGGELHPDPHEAHAADSRDDTESEGGELFTRGCFICFYSFLGGTGTQTGRDHFLGDANLFPTDSEGRVGVSPSTKCLVHILASLGSSFSWTCNV